MSAESVPDIQRDSQRPRRNDERYLGGETGRVHSSLGEQFRLRLGDHRRGSNGGCVLVHGVAGGIASGDGFAEEPEAVEVLANLVGVAPGQAAILGFATEAA